MELKIHVSNLGIIKKADIELKPLTIFAGPNNTNKTWLSSLIYGVFNGDTLRSFIEELVKNDTYTKYFDRELFDVLQGKGEIIFNLNEFIQNNLNTILKNVSNHFITKSFATFMRIDDSEFFSKTRLGITLSNEHLDRIIKKIFKSRIEVDLNWPQSKRAARVFKREKEDALHLMIKELYVDKEIAVPSIIFKEIILFALLHTTLFQIYTQVYYFPSERKAISILYKNLKSNPYVDLLEDYLKMESPNKDMNLSILKVLLSSTSLFSKINKTMYDYINFLYTMEESGNSERSLVIHIRWTLYCRPFNQSHRSPWYQERQRRGCRKILSQEKGSL
ncbi:MAG: hypothetical protein HQK89_13775, partial [Nitrospirae bacterium]|nr:hypothetical protein [Nitrospirota bacterium]